MDLYSLIGYLCHRLGDNWQNANREPLIPIEAVISIVERISMKQTHFVSAIARDVTEMVHKLISVSGLFHERARDDEHGYVIMFVHRSLQVNILLLTAR